MRFFTAHRENTINLYLDRELTQHAGFMKFENGEVSISLWHCIVKPECEKACPFETSCNDDLPF